MGKPFFATGKTWTAEDNLSDAIAFRKDKKLAGAATFSWFTAAGVAADGTDVLGFANTGYLCDSNYRNTNINENQGSVTKTAWVRLYMYFEIILLKSL